MSTETPDPTRRPPDTQQRIYVEDRERLYKLTRHPDRRSIADVVRFLLDFHDKRNPKPKT